MDPEQMRAQDAIRPVRWDPAVCGCDPKQVFVGVFRARRLDSTEDMIRFKRTFVDDVAASNVKGSRRPGSARFKGAPRRRPGSLEVGDETFVGRHLVISAGRGTPTRDTGRGAPDDQY
jgi:hypothetical protein